MESSSSHGSSSDYLESLMRVGEQATKQFDEALAAAMGIESKPVQGGPKWPFSVAGLQDHYWSPVLEFWRGFFNDKPAADGNGPARAARGDRRFNDDAWSHSPYYDLLRKSYLSSSRQLSEFVDQAQVDERSRLQLRFYARQFIDAMSPSNFPATNPDVIRTAIRTRAGSLASGMQNMIEDLQKGRITRVDETAF